ncbi:MAG: diacylglycerol kinase family protein [Flavobacteriales bacterium]|jgi:diacylglycerol kinase (ATP)|nr:diacylglycerol kinase family protein [Flavobacteriales bacterium]
MKPDDGFVLGRLKSTIYAFRGLWVLIATEHSFMFHGSISIVLIVLGFYNNITTTEWGLQVVAIGLVMGAEALNTAIEKLADHIEPDLHKTIGVIKDVGAAAVLVGLFVEIAIVALIYVPRFL